MKTSKVFLSRLMQTLVEEWGHDEVATALASTSTLESSLRRRAAPKLFRNGGALRQSAISQVERAALNTEQRKALLELADRYDRKQFLPSVADVREFIVMMGERPIGMKDRKEAFRVLLRSLSQLPTERLQSLALTAQHSGPSELGPLSDAIAAASERLPRHQQDLVDSNTHALPQGQPHL